MVEKGFKFIPGRIADTEYLVTTTKEGRDVDKNNEYKYYPEVQIKWLGCVNIWYEPRYDYRLNYYYICTIITNIKSYHKLRIFQYSIFNVKSIMVVSIMIL